jgi:DNA topoisomerase I
VFYGCGNYPKCDAVFWDKPVMQACPQCQKVFTLEKYNAKKDETMHYCADEACGYRSDGSIARPRKVYTPKAEVKKAPAAKKAPAKKAATKKAAAPAAVVAAAEAEKKPVARLRKAAKTTE